MTPPLRVLFVCTANVCRSPFLELYARSRLDSPSVTFSSAGTHALDGQPMSEEISAEATRAWGLDVHGFRSRRLTPDLVAGADLVLTAEQRHTRLVVDGGAGAAGTVLTLGQAARAAATATTREGATDVVAGLAERRGAPEPGDDVGDPYQLGAQAQSAAARQMGAMLDALLPLLAPLDRPTAGKPTHG
jgi:protein-tyrosine-phosphatase